MSAKPTPPPQVVEASAYVRALLKTIPQAKKRIVLASMFMFAGPQTDPVFAAIKDALGRGVRVRILLDGYFTRFEALRYKDRRGRLKQSFAILDELKTLGARVYSFGKITLVPYRGRCHIKLAVVDDTVYSFGGVNFSEESLALTNYMVKIDSAAYGDCLEELIKRIGGSRPPLENGEVAIDDESTILFDGGKPHNSLIYEKACELVAQSKKVYYVSKTMPSSKLAHLLHEVDSTIYSNRPEQMRAPDSWGQAFDQQKYRLTNAYKGTTAIDAKFILFELPHGRRALITGSNNFSYRGVAFGTQEIALYSTNKKLWEQLHSFLQKHLS